ncbi:transcriptional regulator (ArsR-family protein) [Desulforapulum autotrophicum HRM2]|uniref:Transcriptional regulator (ArsR-family protein) n=1 Tax=Desulforapulum autotrophicum (strain ATCC 43914 / DSM 3382 / VKM B-1955 / HRM2) TaxID=177437 RepID=C0QFV8_DESAH|nr:metalloregulator ArsR/SmtB family transcription factor [Desulforapulum autotrophicum]ACN15526.1 transcriptional regulator (ArsR-family protein) [Desulforapulum autotrophicum HRM2]
MEQMDPRKLEENAEKASRLLKSMGHPSRLMVLCHLMKGECPVSVLNQAIPLSQSALSQHLAGLRQAGLVETRRESQVIYYRLKSKAVSRILEALYCIYCNPNVEE